jgi:hypothetical protein
MPPKAADGGSEGLWQQVAPLREAATLSIDKRDTEIDIWSVLGGKKEETSFYYRSLALSNPAMYEKLRSEAMAEVGLAVNASFKSSFAAYQSSGYPKEESEYEAMKAASAAKEMQMRAFRSKFPSADESLYSSANARNGSLISTALPAARKKSKAKKRK